MVHLSDMDISDHNDPNGIYHTKFFPALSVFLKNGGDMNKLVTYTVDWTAQFPRTNTFVAKIAKKETLSHLLSLGLVQLDAACTDSPAHLPIHEFANLLFLEHMIAILNYDPSYINRQRADGKTPLHLVLSASGYYGCVEKISCFQYLLRQGANLWLKDAVGKSPLEYISGSPHGQILIDKCIGDLWGLLQEKSKTKELVARGSYDDILLVVTDNGTTKTFASNRLLLAAHSDKFRAMFRTGMKESRERTIELKANISQFSALMEYFESGTLAANITLEGAIELYHIADEYLATI
eukprot:TRINITY_DN22879_c0_g1_i1.p1 TRINITY_DN22879_c0_g1~~TRINITY_DN22879_c0_g1_i1.p1  ORF type:complete len:295 (+),score=41.17 TRINITY_DN22879_c0_g1_i1:3-887(+)